MSRCYHENPQNCLRCQNRRVIKNNEDINTMAVTISVFYVFAVVVTTIAVYYNIIC